MKVPEGRPKIARRFNGGFRSLKPIKSRRDERKHAFVGAISAAPSGLARFVFTPTVKTVYVFGALRTRHGWSESAGLAVAAAFGVRQLVGAFARGTGESVASWLALAEDSGDKSPHSKRWRDCETAASVPTPGLCDALNRYKTVGYFLSSRWDLICAALEGNISSTAGITKPENDHETTRTAD